MLTERAPVRPSMPPAKDKLHHAHDSDYLGLATDRYAHYEVIGQRVEWVAWDSPAQTLGIGDIVLKVSTGRRAVEGADLPRLIYPYAGSSAFWSALGIEPGASLTFTLLRGGDVIEETVEPVPQRFYRSHDDKRSLFPDGPYAGARDGFSEGWSTWYERIIKAWSAILADGWRQRSFKTRALLKAHDGDRRRVDFLLEHYPGDFAQHIDTIWRHVETNLSGQLWPRKSVNLTYRELAKKRRERVKAAAKAAHKAYEKTYADTIAEAFPAPDPYETEAGSVEGKLIVVDRVSPRDMRNDGAQAWYILGDRRKGWYFLNVHSPEVRRMWDGIVAYQRQVTPHLPESYRFYLRVTEAPMMRAKGKRSVAMGFKTQLVAAFIGRELFLSELDTEQPAMAGRDILKGVAIDPPPDDAAPEALAARRIDAVKLLRRDVWEALYADWTVSSDFSNQPIFLPYGYGRSAKHSGWEQCQKRILSDVFDIKVLASSSPVTVLEMDDVDGTPQVEECEVIVEHVGEFDGEYRSFKDSWLQRAWRMQRVDGGPWRFVWPSTL